MSIQKSSTSTEIAVWGDAIYEVKIRPQFKQSQVGKVVAIDISFEIFAFGDTVLEAAVRLREQQPEAQVWFARVGSRCLRVMR